MAWLPHRRPVVGGLMANHVKDIDRGWKRIKRDLKELKTLEVVIGAFSDQAEANGMNMARLGTILEFGASWIVTRKQAYYMARFLMGIDPDNEPGRFWGTYRSLIGKKMTIPERSFLRATFDQERGNIEIASQRTLDLILEGKYDVMTGLGRFGAFVQSRVQQKIQSTHSPANAPLTIRLKGSAHPLISTGRFKNSIRYIIRKA